MKQINQRIQTISSICISIVLVFHTAMITQVIPKLVVNNSWAIVGSLLGSTGLYIGLFNLFVFLYRLYFWKLFSRRIDISGYWNNEVYDSKGNLFRRGEFYISQNYDEISVYCKNYDLSSEPRLMVIWQTEQAWIEGLILHVTYNVRSVIEEVPNKNGRAVFQLDGKSPPQSMTGAYYSDSQGSIVLRRIKAKSQKNK